MLNANNFGLHESVLFDQVFAGQIVEFIQVGVQVVIHALYGDRIWPPVANIATMQTTIW